MIKEQNKITLADNSVVVFTVYYRIDEGYGLEITIDDTSIKDDSFGHTPSGMDNATKWKNFVFTKLAKEIHFLPQEPQINNKILSLEELIGEEIMDLWCYYDEDTNRVQGLYQEILNLIGGK